jgi:ABC-type phosphate transport system substrate-binding protein
MDKTTAAMMKVLMMVIMFGVIAAVILKPTGALAASGTPGQNVSQYLDVDGTYHSFNTLAELQQYVMTNFPGEPIPIEITWQ